MPEPEPGRSAKDVPPGDAAPRDAVENDFRRVCPNCGALLVDRSCKSRCLRCHFFTDCSDPW